MLLTWLKLDINILNDSKIKIIRKYPEGDSLIVLWIGLLCLAMRSGISGLIYIAQGIPYDANALSLELDIPEKTVEMGMSLFQKFGMIATTQDGYIEVINFNKHQEVEKIENKREKDRERQARYRLSRVTNGDVTQQNRVDNNKIEIEYKEDESTKAEPTAHSRFIKPTLSQIQEYITELKSNGKIVNFSADKFFDANELKGWVYGKNNIKIKDWKAAVRTWIHNDFKCGKKKEASNNHECELNFVDNAFEEAITRNMTIYELMGVDDHFRTILKGVNLNPYHAKYGERIEKAVRERGY